MSISLNPGITLSEKLGTNSDAMSYIAEIIPMDPPKEAIEDELRIQVDGAGFAAMVSTALFYINQL